MLNSLIGFLVGKMKMKMKMLNSLIGVCYAILLNKLLNEYYDQLQKKGQLDATTRKIKPRCFNHSFGILK